MDYLPILHLFFTICEILFLRLLFFWHCLIWKDIQRSIDFWLLLVIDCKHDTFMRFYDLLLELWKSAAILWESIKKIFGSFSVTLFLLLIFIGLIECFYRFLPFFARVNYSRVTLIVSGQLFFFRSIFIETMILNCIFE